MGKTGAFLSHLKPKDPLLTLIIFFSATQLGLHFWPLSALVYGVRIDYLSPTLYFLDLLIILYIYIQKLYDFTTLRLVIPPLLTNLLFSQNPLSTFSWSFHLLLYLIFLTTLFSDPQRKFENWRIYDLRLILTLALFFQLALATAQVSLGHSVGGLMYYLGERTVAVGQPTIALGSFMDSVVLRAYGTFGHPNVLAGWAVVCLLIIIRLSKKIPWGILLFTTLLLILTESRAAALSLFGLIIPICLLKHLKSRIIYFILLLIPIYYFLIPNPPPRSDLSSAQRLDLQGVSSQVIRQYPIFGTGAQANISTYPTIAPTNRLLQPDHNSLTLFLSWFGIFGILAILYSLRSHLIPNFYILIPIAPILALDHYLLTSPQGLFILTLYLSVALNYTHVKNHRQ